MRRSKGFTLVELTITLVIAVILIAVAAPPMKEMVDSNRKQAVMHEFRGFVQLARSESVTRNVNVVVCRTEDAYSCIKTSSPRYAEGWGVGWLMFTDPERKYDCTDTDRDRVCEEGGTALRVQQTLHPTLRMYASHKNHADQVVYTSRGWAENGAIGHFFVCDQDKKFRSATLQFLGTPRDTTAEEQATITCPAHT